MKEKFRIVISFLVIMFFPALIFLIAGDWEWKQAWIFAIWLAVLSYTLIMYLYRRDPAHLAERYRYPGSGGQPFWDKLALYGIYAGFSAWIVIMPLDTKRFGWSPAFPLWLQFVGVALLALSFLFFFRSYTDNPFLSPLVRVQTDRGHTVVSRGVYRLIRHPMYLGASLMFLGTPLLLGSLFGLPAGLALTALLMARSVAEENLLSGKLPGYAEYMENVRYRLFPFIW